MIGAQFIAKTQAPHHTCHPLHNRPTKTRSKKRDPISHYTNIIDSIGPTNTKCNISSVIHTHVTASALSALPPNVLLNSTPPPINPAEKQLPRQARVSLAQLRSGSHPSLNTFRHKMNPKTSPYCPTCPDQPHSVQHVLLHCPALSDSRSTFNISSLRDLWERPSDSYSFVLAAGLQRA